MCGIITHLHFDIQSRIDQTQCSNLNNYLTHRGPDDAGVFVTDHVAMAMRRLSIVDIAHGQQPLSSEDGRFTIVFNGEIYNHQALKKILATHGVMCKTNSDTEVLLKAYITWGKDCLNELNGMFAFSIWDAQTKTLFVARDRMGQKPLYYARNSQRILFASELTPIMRSGFFDLTFNLKAISDYLSFWYICEPDTIYENVQQLPPGHYAIIADARMEIHAYWQIPTQEKSIAYDDAKDQLDHLLQQAVSDHLGADVPLGTFLSGGIDSGLVTAMATKKAPGRLQSFGIGFADKSYDETELATLSANRCGVDLDIHIMEDVTPDLIDTIIGSFDEPLGNASYVPSYLLARAARSKLKVVLTGDGGDELFGGYPTYQAPYYQAMWNKVPKFAQTIIKSNIAKMPVSHKRISLDFRLKQLMQGIDADYKQAHYTWRQVTSMLMQRQLWRPEVFMKLQNYDPFEVAERYFIKGASLSKVNQLMHVDLNTYLLNDHLRKVDRMTMAHGLEARVPLLDHRVVEFAAQLPDTYKVNLRRTKRILKDVASGYLPRAVIAGKKKGLTAPIAGWIDGPLKNYLMESLKGGLVQELFNTTMVETLCQEHWTKQKDNSRVLWALLTLQVWYKKMKGNI